MRGWLLLILAVVVGGCAGYKVGPTNGVPAGSRTVKFAPFVNKTLEPRVTEYLGNSLRKQLQQDGTYRLETSGSPDIMVTGEVTRLLRSILSYDPNDVLTPNEYQLTLEAHIRAININTGKTIVDNKVTGTTFIRVGNDEFSSERQAIPLLTDTLAHNAISMLVDGPW
jgi:hypothetical protein